MCCDNCFCFQLRSEEEAERAEASVETHKEAKQKVLFIMGLWFFVFAPRLPNTFVLGPAVVESCVHRTQLYTLGKCSGLSTPITP